LQSLSQEQLKDYSLQKANFKKEEDSSDASEDEDEDEDEDDDDDDDNDEDSSADGKDGNSENQQVSKVV
jgi:hypothetical protein